MIDAAFAGVNGGLADQLYQTAKLIGARTSLGVARQGFFVSMGGYDTHNEQRGEHAQRLSELAPISPSVVRTTPATTAPSFPASRLNRSAPRARWFGVPAAALSQVFPNLGAFPVADLAFVG